MFSSKTCFEVEPIGSTSMLKIVFKRFANSLLQTEAVLPDIFSHLAAIQCSLFTVLRVDLFFRLIDFLDIHEQLSTNIGDARMIGEY